MAERYSATSRFRVVMEPLTSDKSSGQVAKVYGVHPNTLKSWKRTLLEKGPEFLSGRPQSQGHKRGKIGEALIVLVCATMGG